jgi:hypothetical protein
MPEIDVETQLENLSPHDKPRYEALMSKVFENKKEKIVDAISQKIEAGALNVTSALAKLMREYGRKEMTDTIDISGYFLTRYQLQPREQATEGVRQFSVYLATKRGVATIHADSREDLPSPKAAGLTAKVFGEKQKWTGLKQYQNILSGNISYGSAKSITGIEPATAEEIGPKLWEICNPITKIEDGQGIWKAYVGVVGAVGIFSQQGQKEPDDYKQILENNGVANLRVGLAPSIDRKTGRVEGGRDKTSWITMASEAQLRTFLREYFNDTFLIGDPEDIARELTEALQGQPVVVFGQGQTPNSPRLTKEQRNRMKGPKIQIWQYGVISPWKEDN